MVMKNYDVKIQEGHDNPRCRNVTLVRDESTGIVYKLVGALCARIRMYGRWMIFAHSKCKRFAYAADSSSLCLVI